MRDVGQTQATQQQRVREYDQMHAIVREERQELGIHVAAGRVRDAGLQQGLAALAEEDAPPAPVHRRGRGR